jgi:amino acid adenylation domain-containing protein
MTALSPAQRGIWAAHVLAEDKALFNTAECLVLSGKVDAARLEVAIEQVVGEADCLSCHYRATADGRGERVPAEPALTLARRALDGPDAWTPEVDLGRPFELERSLPCRFTLVEGEAESRLYLTAHHVALDGYGYALVWQRLAEVYAALEQQDLPPACSFGRFEEVLAETAAPTDEARAFWQATLQGSSEPARLGLDLPLARGYAETAWTMPQPLWEAVGAFAAKAGLTWADVLLAAVSVLLRERTGMREQILGLPVMNRTGSKALDVPCMHMNITPLRLTIGDDDDLASMGRKIAAERRRCRRFQSYRHEEIARDLLRAGARDRVFGTMVNVLPFARALRFGSLTAQNQIVCAGPVPDLAIVIHYASRATAPILTLAGHARGLPLARLTLLRDDLSALLATWLEAPERKASALVLARNAAKRQRGLIGEPAGEATATAGIFARIAAQAHAFPSRTAVEQAGQALSYAELVARAERWAGALQALGVQPGDYVGLTLPRSLDAMTAILAVLRAGACYVPLDPEQPAERLAGMLEQLDLAWMIAGGEAARLPLAARPRRLTPADLERSACPPASDRPGELAYVLFTSGSTGRPKGVAVEAASLEHFIAAANLRYGITPRHRVLQFAPLHFDTSLEEIFVTLAHGATLVLRGEGGLDAMAGFAKAVEEARISVLDLPTAFWSEWTEAVAAGRSFVPQSLETVILGGEAVRPEKLRQWLAAARELRLVNSYGPTETTIVATTADLTARHASLPYLPIGRPLPGVSLLVLDAAGRPSDEGELVILGPTVGLRYLAPDAGPLRSSLVEGRDLPAYRTGDRVRLEHGELVYLGRLDEELKISGHRVHPHEVEAQLLRLPEVAEACVQGVRDASGRMKLAACVVPRAFVTQQTLRAHLQKALPAAMVPCVWKIVTAFPRTATNKIDRAALARLLQDSDRPLEQERTPLAVVRTVWREVLGHGDFDDHDSFYDVGGQSIQALQIALRLSQRLSCRIEVADVLRRPVLRSFCEALDTLLEPAGGTALRATPVGRFDGGRRLFAFPGIGGNAGQFLDLSRRLAPAGRIEVVEPLRGHEGDALPFASLDAWAQACADFLERTGEADGYRLLGHSFGGCLAFEVGKLLERRGGRVELWLLDSYFHLDRGQGDLAALKDVLATAVDERLAAMQLAFMQDYAPTGELHGASWLVYAQGSARLPAETLARARERDARLFAGRCETLVLPGDHFTMLKGDNTSALAARLRGQIHHEAGSP